MDVDIDDPLRILCARPRRLVLLALSRESEATTLSEIAARMPTNETDARLLLCHVHLPKLADRGYVDWDRETGEVCRGPRFEEIAAVLELLDEHADALPFAWP